MANPVRRDLTCCVRCAEELSPDAKQDVIYGALEAIELMKHIDPKIDKSFAEQLLEFEKFPEHRMRGVRWIQYQIPALNRLINLPVDAKTRFCPLGADCRLPLCSDSHTLVSWLAFNLYRNPQFKGELCRYPERLCNPAHRGNCPHIHLNDPYQSQDPVESIVRSGVYRSLKSIKE